VKFLCLVYGAAGADLGEAERLRPAETATTVRVRDGRVQVTDGPLAETPEELSAFAVLECPDLDEALSRAAELHAGAVEVRPEYVEASA
jgi:hypothetical protein